MRSSAGSVKVDHFSMVPRADIPRSTFNIEHSHKTTFDAGFLIPVYVDEVLPGDTMSLNATMFCRMSTPIFPVMDNLYLDSFFFFVPARLVWTNWLRFMGEQANPTDSISFIVPTLPSAAFATNSIWDYFGLPGINQITAAESTFNVLPFRAYNLIWNQWFRDENLQNSVVVPLGDAGDTFGDYNLLRRGKRHDYFTSALPFAQKFTAPSLPLGSSAPVRTSAVQQVTGAQTTLSWRFSATGNPLVAPQTLRASPAFGDGNTFAADGTGTTVGDVHPTNLFADLSLATSASINAIRLAFQTQKLLERDARGGTRYTEIIRSHFGVVSPDARLQRAEYLGGGSTPINVTPIAQTSVSAATPLATLGAFVTGQSSNHSFSQSFTEHGYIIGLVSVRADLTYQQGLRRMWSRSTRYDFYFPVFANLGEQAVLRREIFQTGVAAQDTLVFGYQERWAEYRYHPSRVSGLFRSTASSPIDAWHLAQRFLTFPTLNSTFIEDTPPLQRVIAVGAAALGQQFIFDSLFKVRAGRPMPMYSVPGLIDHF